MHPETNLRTRSVSGRLRLTSPGPSMPNSLQVGEMPLVEPEPDEVLPSELNKPPRRRHGQSKPRLSVHDALPSLLPTASLMVLDSIEPPLPAALLLSDDEDEVPNITFYYHYFYLIYFNG